MSPDGGKVVVTKLLAYAHVRRKGSTSAHIAHVADTGSRPAAPNGFNRPVSEQPWLLEHSEPNAVLRGGPLDGSRIHVDRQVPLIYQAGDQRVTYRPTAELDTEFPALTVWVFDHAEMV